MPHEPTRDPGSLKQGIDEGKQVDCVYLDLKKAFDRVPHSALLKKLEAHGFQGKVLRWIKNFLKDRTQRVRVGDAVSQWEPVRSGVAQGTVLGPILFLVFINDLGDDLESTIQIFADDTKVYRIVEAESDNEKLQGEILQLQRKAASYGMEYNGDKCVVMNVGKVNNSFEYHLINEKGERIMLKNIKCEKELGEKVHGDLKVEEQVKVAPGRASVSMRQMKNTFKYMTPEIFKTLYCSHVRPHMEFSIQSWSPYLKKDVEKHEKLQRRATKLVRGIRNRP